VQRSPPSSGMAPAVPPGVVYTATPPPAPTPTIRVDTERGSTSIPPSPRLMEHPIGPDGHRDARLHRGDAPRILGNPPPSPGTGIPTVPNSSDPCFGARFEEFRGGTTSDNTRPSYNPTPKMDFPKFDGGKSQTLANPM
jgi:hypothetical protein